MDHYVLAQQWIESERGWGVRPDGYSLHIDDDCRRAFIKKYWDGMPNATPAVFSAPYGDPELIPVTEEVYNTVAESPKGVWWPTLPKM